jgi:hypothetical protein
VNKRLHFLEPHFFMAQARLALRVAAPTRPDDIVGEHAERCFTTDFSKSPGEEPPAGGHSF